MIVLKSTLNAMKAKRDEWKREADRSIDLLAQAREEKRKLGQALHEKVAECDDLQRRLDIAEGELARRKQHAMGNLRQFRKTGIGSVSAPSDSLATLSAG